jgi:hypothetical protein
MAQEHSGLVAALPTEVHELVERAAADPDFVKRLSADPLLVAQEAGVALSAEELKGILGVGAGASDEEVVEALQSRLSAVKSDFSLDYCRPTIQEIDGYDGISCSGTDPFGG